MSSKFAYINQYRNLSKFPSTDINNQINTFTEKKLNLRKMQLKMVYNLPEAPKRDVSNLKETNKTT